MTMFSTFSGLFSISEVYLYSDFITSTLPFNTAKDATLGDASSPSNANSGNCLGKITLTTVAATSGSVFQYAGIYMAPAQSSAGAALTRDFRLGNGEVEVLARVQAVTSSLAAHITTVGISTGNYSAATVPATDFVGFFARGNENVWRYGVVINGVENSFLTSFPATSASADIQVIVSKDAKKSTFVINGKNVGTIEAQLRTSAAMIPAIEAKDITSGGSGQTAVSVIDYMAVRLRTNR